MRPILLFLLVTVATAATDLGRIDLQEPAGVDWPDEWVRLTTSIAAPARGVRVADLRLVDTKGVALPAQWHRDGKLLADDATLTGTTQLEVLTHVRVQAGAKRSLRIVADPETPVPARLRVSKQDGRTGITNGIWTITLDPRHPLPLNGMRIGTTDLGTFAWPDGVTPTGVTDTWIERGPVRAVLRRDFTFADPAHRYRLTLTMRAGDPWIDCVDAYAFGRGSAITLDLRGLEATHVFHPHSYSPRT